MMLISWRIQQLHVVCVRWWHRDQTFPAGYDDPRSEYTQEAVDEVIAAARALLKEVDGVQ